MMKSSLTLFGILFILNAFSQVEQRSYYADEGLVPVEHQVDMQHLKLEVSFEVEEGLVKGLVKERFKTLRKSVDSLNLNAIRMNFDAVKLDGKEVEYKYDNKVLTLIFEQALSWGSEHEIEISYTATPKKGLYFIGWNDTTERARRQIWTQGQGIDNRHWIPMYDEKNDKFISELIVDFDEKYKVLSNGERLKEKSIGNGMKRWHYKISHPHPSYLIMLGIGDYAIDKRKSASGVEMDLYYYPEQAEQVEPTYRFSVEMFDFFEQELGVPYPWENYAQIPVQDFMYGAMENTTATIFGDFYLVDSSAFLDRNYVRVNAHELAHQWFGDMITARSSAHHWLQESFATHYDMMYQREAFGQDYFDWVRRGYNNQALDASKTDLKPIAHSSAGSVRHYPKGAFVLEMLKYVVGRDQFNAAIKYYLEKHAFGNVDSKDLLVAFHERLGLSLDWFWEDWVYKGGEPEYEVEFKSYDSVAVFNVKQLHQQNDLVDLFKMPIVFQLHYEDGSHQEKKVWIENQSHQVSFKLESGKKISYALFDPNSQIMKKVNFSKPLEMLKAQAENAEHMLDRYDAIKALASIDFAAKDVFLMKRYQAEEFYAIKAEIIEQVVPLLNTTSFDLARLAIRDESTEVKMALLKNTVRIPEAIEGDYKRLLKDPSYEVVEKALNMLSFYYPGNRSEYLDLTQSIMGDRSHNVRISWLKIAYQNSGDDKYLDELIDYCGPSFEFLTRINAAESLKELNKLNELALANMLDATFSFNRRLVGPVREVISHFFEQAEYKSMIVNYVSNQKWSDLEFRKVNRYLVP